MSVILVGIGAVLGLIVLIAALFLLLSGSDDDSRHRPE
jgi:hypothetical protein